MPRRATAAAKKVADAEDDEVVVVDVKPARGRRGAAAAAGSAAAADDDKVDAKPKRPRRAGAAAAAGAASASGPPAKRARAAAAAADIDSDEEEEAADDADEEGAGEEDPASDIDGGYLSGEVFIFTGFRDAACENYIKRAHGRVAVTMNKQVTCVITAEGLGRDTRKIDLARERGVAVISREEFYGNMRGSMPSYYKTWAPHRPAVSGAGAASAAAAAAGAAGIDAAVDVERSGSPTGPALPPAEGAFDVRNHVAVFTGFRDAGLERSIKRAGGAYKPSMSKAVTLVIAKDGMQSTNKARAAAERGLLFMTQSEFEKLTGLKGSKPAAADDDDDA